LVFKEIVDPKDLQENEDLKDLREHLAFKESVDLRVSKGFKEIVDHKESKGFKELRVKIPTLKMFLLF
jgi:hypothetical protein